MINLSYIRPQTFIGKILRFPLRMLPPQLCVRVLQGPLRGCRWIVGSSSHGCWLGTYEYRKASDFAKNVHKGSVIYDLGANVGYYTLLSSRIAVLGHVFAFEPLPDNLMYLQKHLHINNVRNVTVIPSAVSEIEGKTYFRTTPSSSMGHIDSHGDLPINLVTLDAMYMRGQIGLPDLIKIDIEGGELSALKGAIHILSKARPTIFLATHGKDVHMACCELLCSHGYYLEALDAAELTKSSEIIAWHKDRNYPE